MNWDALGAIAELAGAAGVIATLIYLATQIRQNSNELADSRTQSVIELMIQTRADLATGPIATIQVKVDAGQELTPEEEIRYRAHRAQAMNIYEVYLLGTAHGKMHASLDGVMSERLLINLLGDSSTAIKNRSLWETTRSMYTSEFQTYVNNLIDERTEGSSGDA